jgi:glycosyltransferase involved in cell wall biosynthesis
MINILFIVSHLQPQGPNKQLLSLCRNLNKENFNLVIVTTSQNIFKNSLHKEYYKFKIQIYDLKLSKVQSIIRGTKEIQNIINLNKIDIIFSYGFRSDFISSKLKSVIKVSSVRNTLLLNWKITWGPFLGSIFGKINLYYIKKFDYVIACSSSVSNHLYNLNLQNITIRNSIDALRLQKKFNKCDFKNKDKPKSLLTISSKLKGKNIEFLLKSFTNKELYNYKLYVAGYVEPNTIKEFNCYSNIKFLGHIHNLYDYINTVDFFISASLHEGMPNAVLESLAIGTPVILSDINSHKEIFNQQEYKIGSIFKNNSYASLKNSIDEVFKLKYKYLSLNCKNAVLENFSIDKMTNEYENFFSSIVNP